MPFLLGRLTKGATHPERLLAATALARCVKDAGISALQQHSMLASLNAALDDQNAPNAREGALLAIGALCQWVGPPCEPHVVPLLPQILERFSDKVRL